MQLSIIIPVYNEQDNVLPMRDKLVAALGALGMTYEVIFINDGSTDLTAQRLDEVAAALPDFKAVHLRRNFGQTAAMMAGIDHSTGDIVIPMDGDLQNDPDDIRKLLAKLDEGFDVVSGWRKDRQDAELSRNLPSRIANRLISRISGVHLHDYGCSLKAYRRSILKDVRLYGEMHRFIPIYAYWQGAKVAEVPVTHHARKFGTSKYGIERTIKVVLDLIVVKFREKYGQKPIYVFGGLGFAALGVSVLCLLWMLFMKFVQGTAFISTPVPTLAAMFFFMGVVSIELGLIAELLMRTYYESQGKRTYIVGSTRNFAGKYGGGDGASHEPK